MSTNRATPPDPNLTPLSLVRRADRPRRHEGGSPAEQAVFAATERLLVREPLHDLSVAQIMREAGISRATFYFYFSSKYAVVSGLLAQVMDEMFELVQPFVSRPPEMTPEEALETSIAAGIAMWTRHRPAMQAIHESWNSTADLQSLWLEVMERFIMALAERIDRDREAGLTPAGPDSRTLAATLLWSTECCLYISSLGVDASLSDETAMLVPLTTMWKGTLLGTAPPTPASA